MGVKYLSFCFLIVLLAFSGIAKAEEQAKSLTLSDAVRMALENNPGLKAAQAQVSEAFFGYKQAGSLPSLELAGNYSGGTNTVISNNGLEQDFNFILSQSFGPIGSVPLAGKAAFRSYEAAEAGYEEARLALTQNVKDGFYGLLAAQEQLDVARENLTLARRLYDLTRKQFSAGAIPQTDLVSAQIQEASAEQTLIQAQGAEKQASAALNALLAFPGSQSTVVAGTMDLIPLGDDLQSLLLWAEENRPAVKQAQKNLDQAQTEIAYAKSQRNPAPSLFFNQDVTTTSLYLFGVSLQFPVFDYGQISNQVKIEESTAVEKENDLKETLLTVDQAVKSGFAAYQAAYENAAAYREKVLSPSERLMEMTEFGYRRGALPYLQVLTAEQNLKAARTQYISLLLTGHQAMDALEAAVGKPLEGGGKQ